MKTFIKVRDLLNRTVPTWRIWVLLAIIGFSGAFLIWRYNLSLNSEFNSSLGAPFVKP